MKIQSMESQLQTVKFSAHAAEKESEMTLKEFKNENENLRRKYEVALKQIADLQAFKETHKERVQEEVSL